MELLVSMYVLRCHAILRYILHIPVGPIYTITNTQRIRIYSGKLKSILVKISPDPGR